MKPENAALLRTLFESRPVAALGTLHDGQPRSFVVFQAESVVGSLTIHQNARIYVSTIDSGNHVSLDLPAGRHAWLQVLRGGVSINCTKLETSDGAAVSEESSLSITADADAEILLFDLA
jgi:redox-sensitive bicupin YhaK (pirin superfamily)